MDSEEPRGLAPGLGLCSDAPCFSAAVSQDESGKAGFCLLSLSRISNSRCSSLVPGTHGALQGNHSPLEGAHIFHPCAEKYDGEEKKTRSEEQMLMTAHVKSCFKTQPEAAVMEEVAPHLRQLGLRADVAA